MIDIEEVAGKEAMNVLNAEFGRNRAIFFQCDVANNSEFDGNYIFIQYTMQVFMRDVVIDDNEFDFV